MRRERAAGSLLAHVEKSTVLQEARQVFNQSPTNARRCSQVLARLLYVLNHNEPLSKTEATEAFFAVTKLFQSQDVRAAVAAWPRGRARLKSAGGTVNGRLRRALVGDAGDAAPVGLFGAEGAVRHGERCHHCDQQSHARHDVEGRLVPWRRNPRSCAHHRQ